MRIEDVKSVYFIGIGGIGMSALARFFNEHKVTVAGYDKTSTPLTQALEEEGIKIYFTEDKNHISTDVDLVVYTPAIPSSHKELEFVRESNIPLLKRAQVLGLIVNSGDCFAVAGSHGKSTTSAMLSHVMQVAELDPTGFLGAIAVNYQSNYISGSANRFVVEADEYDRSFHQIKPLSTIITAVDSDHLDIYGSVEGVEEGFQIYLEGLRPNGTIFIQANDEFKHKIQQDYFTYGIDIEADYCAGNVRLIDGAFHFDVQTPNGLISDIQLHMGGRYNIENALAVIAMATHYGVAEDLIKEAMRSFKGLYRRFEFVLNTPAVTFIDDYAHHPNEIRAFIQGVRELYPNKKITGIFQPHLYSRTKDYAGHFAESLSLLDDVYVMDVYPAREEPIVGVNAHLILEQVTKQSKYLPVHEIGQLVEDFSNEVLLTIGAGDIAKQVPMIKDLLSQKVNK